MAHERQFRGRMVMMKFHSFMRQPLLALLLLAVSGCVTHYVPQGGSITVTVVEGGLVETLQFARGATLNIQITQDNLPGYEDLAPHVLTIGSFSPVFGSGFAKRSNIFYESAIDLYGKDVFEVNNLMFQVYWREVDVIPGTDYLESVFSVTVQQIDF